MNPSFEIFKIFRLLFTLTVETHWQCIDALGKKESEELEEVLDSVINKRVTIPKKCMELHRKAVGYELARLVSYDN